MILFFWNTNKSNIITHIKETISLYRPDFIFLAELDCNIFVAMENDLEHLEYIHVQNPGCDRITIFTKHDSSEISLLIQSSHYSMISYDGILLAAVHFPSLSHRDFDELRRSGEKLNEDIILQETLLDNKNTAIIGDFNINPFDNPMISFTGVCSTNHKNITTASITRDKETRNIFYNPMWTMYGKHTERPGTLNYHRTGRDIIQWHILDQIIIRPCLIDRFDFEYLDILTNIGNYSLVNDNGKPNVSDHLPILCRIN